jgi:hypothetical protein
MKTINTALILDYEENGFLRFRFPISGYFLRYWKSSNCWEISDDFTDRAKIFKSLPNKEEIEDFIRKGESENENIR